MATRCQQLLELRDLEMDQPREGRIHSVWGLQAVIKPLEALAERGSDFERHPGATLQEGAHRAALLHGSSERKKAASSWPPLCWVSSWHLPIIRVWADYLEAGRWVAR
jgi:hypothetical protein